MFTRAKLFTPSAASAAIVCRPPHFREASDQYLVLTEDGQPKWVSDPESATPFPSMREAARMAFRLPASDRAYGLPRDSEITIRRELH